MSEGKRELLELQKEGKFLFHGSPTSGIVKFEPRQAMTLPKGKTKQEDMVPDGEPAVAATPYVDIAIFRAIVTKGYSRFGASGYTGDMHLKFIADQVALQHKNDKSYIYVFPRDKFAPRSGNPASMEWRSSLPVSPIKMIEVHPEDLPENIQIAGADGN